jgi:hypothetical protein
MNHGNSQEEKRKEGAPSLRSMRSIAAKNEIQ